MSTIQEVFKNFPLSDFALLEKRTEMEQALKELAQRLISAPFKAAPIIGGKVDAVGERVVRKDPSDHSVTIGETAFATLEQTARAISLCAQGFSVWRRYSALERSKIIDRLGGLITERASFFKALLIREAGKTWREADADVAEAIDFCHFYAAEMRRLSPSQLTEKVAGEDNYYLYQPRGVVAVIAPWNFPLAIACGMTVAALVSGNTALLKPSEQTNIIAFEFAKLVLEAGIPEDCFALIPGRGEEVGRALVEHPAVSMVVFTGSRQVGLEIIRSSAIIRPGQMGIKRVVAELGGKNAIIVDDDADFDDAIRGVLSSAFGFAGQKCSACSRLIVVGSIYESFLSRLAASVGDIIIGPASDPASFYGPVVDEESYERISSLINKSSDLKILAQGEIPDNYSASGWFIPATIFRDVPHSHSVWRDEIFGPVVACTNAASFKEALDIANASEYALTGGVFSRNPAHIELAKEEFRVGNLYINRGITGALVGRQPFGGFKFSGIGSKAGGRDYLVQFMEPRTISENTMRRGFTPE
jgi:RHH-type proline utilization regulon transcriptional repressor/proline dehydrogenase/delta 1-pyrroline-5-carboxylate dehydrogenase